jgi:hypothetical protein
MLRIDNRNSLGTQKAVLNEHQTPKDDPDPAQLEEVRLLRYIQFVPPKNEVFSGLL